MDPSLFRYIWRHSRGEQVFLLLVILASLPFSWVLLEVPKQIVNEAIQGNAFQHGHLTAKVFVWSISLPEYLGGATWHISNGIELTRMPFLFALSAWYLVLVLINNAFKYVINIRKGILGERMLRRLRFELFSILMRFRPEDIATLKPAEVAGMIKDEVEPIGGFIGDAFIQPAFLVTQAATPLLFIIVQSPGMGIAALVVVLAQAIIIPMLRREQIRLGRQRQLASRQLAGRIGEAVENAASIHTFGATGYVEAEIGDRLGVLYTIRADLFRRKFAVKFLNNLLAQLTPFIFYAVGGYFALMGTINIGQLVAVVAAYRDLPPPIKDLIDWDQQRQDVAVKYEQVSVQFSPSRLLPDSYDDKTVPMPAPNDPVQLTSVSVQDARGVSLLDRLSLSLARPSHIALVGNPGGGRDIAARILGRQTLAYQGSVRIGPTELAMFPDEQLSRILGFAGHDPNLMPGSIRDNILFAVKRQPPMTAENVLTIKANEYKRRLEARRSGNPLVSAASDWIDYATLGVAGPDDVDGALRKVLDVAGALPDIYRLGVRGQFDDTYTDEFLDPFVKARHMVRERLADRGLSHLVDSFDPTRYNKSASVGENLLFGVPLGKRLRIDNLARDGFVRSILEAEALMEPLIDIGLRIAEMAVETFAGLPPEHPVFERYSAIRPEDLPRFQEIVDSVVARGTTRSLSASARTRLLGAGLAYIEPRHRLGLVDKAFGARVMRARQSFRTHLPSHYAQDVEFYDPDRYMRAAPVGDNILFGRISYGIPNAPERVYEIARAIVAELDLDKYIFRLGLEFDVGKGGWQLQPAQRARVAICRALVANPAILVLENAFATLTKTELATLVQNIRSAMKDRTLIVTLDDYEEADGFDRIIEFEGTRIVTRDIVELAQTA